MVNLRIIKMLAVGSILLFAGASVVPAQAAAVQPTGSPNDFYIGLQPLIRISWAGNATSKPIMPRSELRMVPMNVSFTVAGGHIAALFAWLLRWHAVTATVEIADKPDWCMASLSVETFQFTIPSRLGVIQTRTMTLTISLTEDAPAYTQGIITLKAHVEPIFGFYGLVRFMEETTETYWVSITPAYWPLLQPTLPQGNQVETPPNTTIEFPAGVTNLGNGRTTVTFDLDNTQGWNIYYPSQIVLDVGEYQEFTIRITAPANFSGEYVFRLSMTPHYFYDMSQTGETISEGILAYYHPS